MLLQTHKTLEENFANTVQSVLRSNMSPNEAADALNNSFMTSFSLVLSSNFLDTTGRR